MMSLTRNIRGLMLKDIEVLMLSRCYTTDRVKRPASSFGIFLKEKQSELKRENPSMTQTEIMKLASSLWKNGSPSNQEIFRKKYEEQLKLFKDSRKEIPKRPPTAFLQFFKDLNPSLISTYPDIKDRAKRCSELWSELSESEKEKYRSDFQIRFQEYQNNLTDDDKREIELRKEARKKRKAKSKKKSES